MGTYNPYFWEIPTDASSLEGVPAEKALWYETETDRERRYALQDFFNRVRPVVHDLIDAHLTERQKEILRLYFFGGKTQQDIARMLALSQSTVSRHLFGTMRKGKKVGGALGKLRKVIAKGDCTVVTSALMSLETRFAKALKKDRRHPSMGL